MYMAQVQELTMRRELMEKEVLTRDFIAVPQLGMIKIHRIILNFRRLKKLTIRQ